MNGWQLLRQVQYRLQQQEWTTSSPVFASNSVMVTVAPDDAVYTGRRSPLALIAPGGMVADDQEPNLLRQVFAVRLVTTNAYDSSGEASILGSNRTGQTDTRGRGLLELEEMLHDALSIFDRTDGVRIVGRGVSRQSVRVQGGGRVSVADHTFEAWVTSDRSYPGVRKLSGSVASDTVTLTWTLPATRYDTLRVVVRRASGSTAPSSPSAGTGVTLGSDLPSSTTDTPGDGTWSYAVFVAYDEYGSATEERYSAGAEATGLVVATVNATIFQSAYFGGNGSLFGGDYWRAA